MVWAGQSGVRTLVEASFFTSVQTGLKACLASCTLGTGLPSWGGKLDCGIADPPLPSAKIKERVELYLYLSCGPS